MTTDSYPDERDLQPHVLEPGDQSLIPFLPEDVSLKIAGDMDD